MLVGVGVTPEGARQRVVQRLGTGASRPAGSLGVAPQTKRLPELARATAKSLSHQCPRTEHILLAATSPKLHSSAAALLADCGASPEQIRDLLARVLRRKVPNSRSGCEIARSCPGSGCEASSLSPRGTASALHRRLRVSIRSRAARRRRPARSLARPAAVSLYLRPEGSRVPCRRPFRSQRCRCRAGSSRRWAVPAGRGPVGRRHDRSAPRLTASNTANSTCPSASSAPIHQVYGWTPLSPRGRRGGSGRRVVSR